MTEHTATSIGLGGIAVEWACLFLADLRPPVWTFLCLLMDIGHIEWEKTEG